MKKQFDVKKYYPDMKLSNQKRGITNSLNYFSSDSNSSLGNLSQGSSIEELKKKYFGNSNIEGGPLKDNHNLSGKVEIFTEDAIQDSKVSDDSDAEIIEPDTDNSDDAAIIGKKTIITTEDGEPKASQG